MQTTKTRILAVVVVAITALLLPVIINAGSLEPPSAPASTMKTLDEIPPTWSRKLSCDSAVNCPRFEMLGHFSNEAVLDKETGLVWERSPSTATFNWYDAQIHCYQLEKGGRKGWHLPTVEQLASLVDPSQIIPVLALPTGHPFQSIQGWFYWSATTRAGNYSGNPTWAWYVGFGGGDVGTSHDKMQSNVHAWCVRGGQNHDALND